MAAACALCGASRADEGLLNFRAGVYVPEMTGHGDAWANVGVDSAPIPLVVPIVGGFRAGADVYAGDDATMYSLSLNRRFGLPRVLRSLPGLYVGAGLGWYRLDTDQADGDGLGGRLTAGLEYSKYRLEAQWNIAGLGDGLKADGVGLTLGIRF